MGYLVIRDPVTGHPLEVWGDKNDIEKFKRDNGFPNRALGKVQTQSEIDEIDEAGQ